MVWRSGLRVKESETGTMQVQKSRAEVQVEERRETRGDSKLRLVKMKEVWKTPLTKSNSLTYNL